LSAFHPGAFGQKNSNWHWGLGGLAHMAPNQWSVFSGAPKTPRGSCSGGKKGRLEQGMLGLGGGGGDLGGGPGKFGGAFRFWGRGRGGNGPVNFGVNNSPRGRKKKPGGGVTAPGRSGGGISGRLGLVGRGQKKTPPPTGRPFFRALGGSPGVFPQGGKPGERYHFSATRKGASAFFGAKGGGAKFRFPRQRCGAKTPGLVAGDPPSFGVFCP